MRYLTRDPIRALDFLAEPLDFREGARVLFLGTVRGFSNGQSVLFLEYEAYEAMAERVLEGQVASAHQQWALGEIKVLHRLGRVELGEIAVAVEVRSAHREGAYEASRYLIDQIKQKVPLWKKEFFSDGTSEWSHCTRLGYLPEGELR